MGSMPFWVVPNKAKMVFKIVACAYGTRRLTGNKKNNLTLNYKKVING